MSTPIITENSIRIFLMDKPELNTYVDGIRFTSEMMEEAMFNVVDYFNVTSPPIATKFTVETFPSRYIMLTGVSGFLLRSASIGQASNHMTFAADGMTQSDSDKAEIFAGMGKEFWEEFKELSRNLKTQANIAAASGTSNSEYLSRFR